MKKGDRVRCINATFEDRNTDPFTKEQLNLPKKGEVYTIRQIVKTEFGKALRLAEIQNSKFQHDSGGLQEPAFAIERFVLC